MARTEKQYLRQQLKKRRSGIGILEIQRKSLKIQENLKKFLESASLSAVYLYFPMPGEPDLSQIGEWLHHKGVSLGFPVVGSESEMEFYEWAPGDPISINRFGIPEPEVGGKVALSPDYETVIIVPALGIDVNGFRIGYGGGYYDRYLAHSPESVTIGTVFDDFVVDEIAHDPWDVRVSWICSESSIRQVNLE